MKTGVEQIHVMMKIFEPLQKHGTSKNIYGVSTEDQLRSST